MREGEIIRKKLGAEFGAEVPEYSGKRKSTTRATGTEVGNIPKVDSDWTLYPQ